MEKELHNVYAKKLVANDFPILNNENVSAQIKCEKKGVQVFTL